MLETNEHELNENEYQDPESSNAEGQEDFFDSLFDESFISTSLDKIYKVCASIKDKFEQLNDGISHLIEEQKLQANNCEQYLQIVANCQKQTAAVIDARFEKNSLQVLYIKSTSRLLTCQMHKFSVLCLKLFSIQSHRQLKLPKPSVNIWTLKRLSLKNLINLILTDMKSSKR